MPPTNLPASTGRWALHPHAAAGEEEGRGTAAIGKYRNAELSTKVNWFLLSVDNVWTRVRYLPLHTNKFYIPFCNAENIN